MKKRGKAQAAMEYLLVVGLVFVIIVPMVYLFYSYSTDMGEEITEAKADRIATSLVNAAEEVFYLGEPSKTTVKFDMPPGVFDITVSPDQRELIFKIGDEYKYTEIVAFSNINIKSYLVPQDFTPGRRSIRAEARPDYVALYTGNSTYAIPRWCAYHIPKQIIDNARLVFDDQIDRAFTLNIPLECESLLLREPPLLPDGSITIPDLNHVLVKIYIGEDEDPTEFTKESDVPIEQSVNPELELTTFIYDFIYKGTSPNYFVRIYKSDLCRDGDNDDYGTVLGTIKCGIPPYDDELDEFDKYDCDDGNININPGANAYCDCDDSDGVGQGTTEICGDGIDQDCSGADC